MKQGQRKEALERKHKSRLEQSASGKERNQEQRQREKKKVAAAGPPLEKESMKEYIQE